MFATRNSKDPRDSGILPEDARARRALESRWRIETSERDVLRALADQSEDLRGQILGADVNWRSRLRRTIREGLVTLAPDRNSATLELFKPRDDDDAPADALTKPPSEIVPIAFSGGAWKVDYRLVPAPQVTDQELGEADEIVRAHAALAADFRSGTPLEGTLRDAVDLKIAAFRFAQRLRETYPQIGPNPQSVPQGAPDATNPDGAALNTELARVHAARPSVPGRAHKDDPPAPGEMLRILAGGRVRDLDLSPDGDRVAVATSHGDEAFGVFELSSGRRVATMDQPRPAQVVLTQRVRFLRDGARVVGVGSTFPRDDFNRTRLQQGYDEAYATTTGETGLACAWDATTGTLLFLADAQPLRTLALAVDPESDAIATGDAQGILRTYASSTTSTTSTTAATTTWTLQHSQDVRAASQDAPILDLAFRERGQRLAMLLVRNGLTIHEAVLVDRTDWPVHVEDGVTGMLALSRDGSRLGVAAANQVRVIDAPQREVVSRLDFPARVALGASVSCVAFSRDGSLLAAADGQESDPDQPRLDEAFADRDPTIRVFDVASGNEVARFEGHRNAITALAFAPDGQRLVSGSADGSVRVWLLGEPQPPQATGAEGK
jgi:WD40 repeat protein